MLSLNILSKRRGKIARNKTVIEALSLSLSVVSVLAIVVSLVSCTRKGNAGENTLNVALEANVRDLDPAHARDQYVTQILAQVVEPLYGYHYLKRPLTLEPKLAQSFPEISPDGLTVTIHLKKGVKYQDDTCFKTTSGKGREVQAQDFIYAWKRLADPTVISDGFWIFDKKIVGLNEWRDLVSKKQADDSTQIEGFQAPDNNTLVIKLTQPYAQLPYVLTMIYSAPVPKECVEYYKQELLNHPIGTGPFQLESWVHNSKIVLVKNPKWRGETYPTEGAEGDKEASLLDDAGKALPFVDKVVFSEIVEDQPQWLNFMKGNLDYNVIPKDNFDATIRNGKLLPEMEKKGIKLKISEEPEVTYYAFNMEDPILGKNKYLRQAISMACDHATLIDRFYNSRAISAQSMIPPSVDGYDTNFKNPYKEFNIEKAKELLKKAGYPNGKGLPEISFDTYTSSTTRQIAELFQHNMSALNIKINIKVSTWPEFDKRTKDKKTQIWGIAWVADYPDAQNFLQLFYGPNAAPGSNTSNYNNPAFNKLYEQASKLSPGPERTKLYQQMRDIVVEDAPWVFNIHRLGYRVHHTWLKNFKRHAMILDNAKYLRVDTKARVELKNKL